MKGTLKGQTEVLTITLVINLGFFKLTEVNALVAFVKGIAFNGDSLSSSLLAVGFALIMLVCYLVYMLGVGGALLSFFQKGGDVTKPIIFALSAFFIMYVATIAGTGATQIPLHISTHLAAPSVPHSGSHQTFK